jgi:hypothetical protein
MRANMQHAHDREVAEQRLALDRLDKELALSNAGLREAQELSSRREAAWLETSKQLEREAGEAKAAHERQVAGMRADAEAQEARWLALQKQYQEELGDLRGQLKTAQDEARMGAFSVDQRAQQFRDLVSQREREMIDLRSRLERALHECSYSAEAALRDAKTAADAREAYWSNMVTERERDMKDMKLSLEHVLQEAMHTADRSLRDAKEHGEKREAHWSDLLTLREHEITELRVRLEQARALKAEAELHDTSAVSAEVSRVSAERDDKFVALLAAKDQQIETLRGSLERLTKSLDERSNSTADQIAREHRLQDEARKALEQRDRLALQLSEAEGKARIGRLEHEEAALKLNRQVDEVSRQVDETSARFKRLLDVAQEQSQADAALLTLRDQETRQLSNTVAALEAQVKTHAATDSRLSQEIQAISQAHRQAADELRSRNLELAEARARFNERESDLVSQIQDKNASVLHASTHAASSQQRGSMVIQELRERNHQLESELNVKISREIQLQAEVDQARRNSALAASSLSHSHSTAASASAPVSLAQGAEIVQLTDMVTRLKNHVQETELRERAQVDEMHKLSETIAGLTRSSHAHVRDLSLLLDDLERSVQHAVLSAGLEGRTRVTPSEVRLLREASGRDMAHELKRVRTLHAWACEVLRACASPLEGDGAAAAQARQEHSSLASASAPAPAPLHVADFAAPASQPSQLSHTSSAADARLQEEMQLTRRSLETFQQRESLKSELVTRASRTLSSAMPWYIFFFSLDLFK